MYSDNMRGTTKNASDGFYDLLFREEGVYIIVYPPSSHNGKKVSCQEIMDRILHKQIKNVNREAVEQAASRSDQMPVRIAEYQEEVKLDAGFVIAVSSDKLKAYVVMTPPEGGKTYTAGEMKELLHQKGIVFGIDENILHVLEKDPIYGESICIAQGNAPVSGRDGKLTYLFNINKERKPTILEDGRVDYRELNLVESVHRGQVLCTAEPPEKGISGKSVFGTDIPAYDGKPAIPPKGRNVFLTEDGTALMASIDGQVELTDGKINVFANYEVPADVDNSTGNIYFIGNVCIRGNVLSGFTVEAGGNVEVWGVVEGAVIKAGGDIILRRGMQGMSKGTLVSGGDIIARYIEHSNIQAKNDIKAEAIMHSQIKCGNRLELAGKKGLLVGGTCRVGREISAKVIGSPMATVTEIEVGCDPTARERYKGLREEIASMENDIRKAEQVIAILKKQETSAPLSPEKQDMLVKSTRTKIFFGSRLNELREEYAALELQLQMEVTGKVKSFDVIYPGTRVSIGSCLMYVKENLKYCTLYRDGADVRVGAIDK